jgi:hypothetical protein
MELADASLVAAAEALLNPTLRWSSLLLAATDHQEFAALGKPLQK